MVLGGSRDLTTEDEDITGHLYLRELGLKAAHQTPRSEKTAVLGDFTHHQPGNDALTRVEYLRQKGILIPF